MPRLFPFSSPWYYITVILHFNRRKIPCRPFYKLEPLPMRQLTHHYYLCLSLPPQTRVIGVMTNLSLLRCRLEFWSSVWANSVLPTQCSMFCQKMILMWHSKDLPSLLPHKCVNSEHARKKLNQTSFDGLVCSSSPRKKSVHVCFPTIHSTHQSMSEVFDGGNSFPTREGCLKK